MMISALAMVGSLAQSTLAPPGTLPPQSGVEQAEGDALGASTFLDFEGSAGYSTNPQLQSDKQSQAFGRVSVYAAHARQGARSSTVFSLYGENTSYSGRTGSQQLLRATASHEAAVNEKLRLFGNVGASLDRGGQLGTRLIGAPNAPVPGTPDAIPTFPGDFDDLVLIGGRTYRLNGQAGAQITLSPRDSMTIRAGAEHAIFRGRLSNNDFTSLSGSGGYNRQLSERSSAGLLVGVKHSDYSDGRTAQEINPQVSGRLQIAERLDLRGAAGVSFAQNDDGQDSQRSVGLTFNGSICGRSEFNTFCAQVARDHQNDSIVGPSKSLSFDANVSHRIDQKQSIQLSAGASRQSSGFDLQTGQTVTGRQTYFRASGAYTRSIGQRWFTGLNVAARALQRNGPDPKPDLAASLFVRWRVGDLR